MIKNQLLTVLKAQAQWLAPWLEITVFGENNAVWQFGTAFCASKQDGEPQLKEGTFIETLSNAKKVKTHTLSLRDNELGKVTIRMRFDITWISNGFFELKQFINQEDLGEKSQGWEASAIEAIQYFIKSKKLKFGALSRLEMRELILNLYEKDLLNYKDATKWLANYLSLSRATIYNYLNWAKSVRKIHIHQVDAFSDKPFAGNPAGVVLDADNLDVETMKSITKELNNAETSFVLPSSIADVKMRYFTPLGLEMSFCGHSTVGALYMLAKEKRLKMNQPGIYQFSVETGAGVIPMGCKVLPEGEISVNFQSPEIKLAQSDITHQEVAEILDIPENHVNFTHALYYEKTNKNLFITVNDLKSLEDIESSPKTVSKFCKDNAIHVICVLTPQAFSSENQIHMRCFAPLVGINEDIFTGSVLGGLIAYAHKNKIIKENEGEIGVEQGHFLSRPGEVRVQYKVKKNQYTVQVFAKANHFFSTQIVL
ncbi:MAG: PhzF family phenazine biosynthesis isomerase [Proteobacteria bacterium]|nr:PhzF family phenazine biosynthesis isomerase [Pseudomonadota bacterium]